MPVFAEGGSGRPRRLPIWHSIGPLRRCHRFGGRGLSASREGFPRQAEAAQDIYVVRFSPMVGNASAQRREQVVNLKRRTVFARSGSGYSWRDAPCLTYRCTPGNHGFSFGHSKAIGAFVPMASKSPENANGQRRHTQWASAISGRCCVELLERCFQRKGMCFSLFQSFSENQWSNLPGRSHS